MEDSSRWEEKAGACDGAPWGGYVRVTLEESSETVTSHTRDSAVRRARKGTFQASRHHFLQQFLMW